MNPAANHKLTVNTEQLQSAVSELLAFTELLKSLSHVPDRALKLSHRISGLFDLPSELVRVNHDLGAAAGTGETVVLVEPGGGLLRCVAAVRAFNREFKVIDGALHKESSL